MERLLEWGGAWLARASAYYGLALVVVSFLFITVAILAVVAWDVVSHTRGITPWPGMPAVLRRWARLGLEISFGLINPVFYLAIPGLSRRSST